MIKIYLAVVNREFFARLDVSPGDVEYAFGPDEVFAVRQARVIHVSRQVLSRRPIDIHVFSHFKDIPVVYAIGFRIVYILARIFYDTFAALGIFQEKEAEPIEPAFYLDSFHKM